jgi:hypothetical protein
MTQSIPETKLAQSETVSVTNLDQFVAMLSAWHGNRVAQMNKLMDIPEDAEVIIEDLAQPVVLTGAVRTGFLIGITTGLAILGVLPFVAEIDDEVITKTGFPDA